MNITTKEPTLWTFESQNNAQTPGRGDYILNSDE
jgi:hypothetical protein